MNNFKKIISLLIKILVFVVMIYFIYSKIVDKLADQGLSLKDVLDFENIQHSDNFMLLVIPILLVIVNWTLESIKWKTLINSILPKFSFIDSIRSILMGVCLGFVTPNRIGEFGGRLFNVKEGFKIKAGTLAFRGGMAQFIITFSFGLVSALFVYKDEMFSNTFVYILLFIVLVILTVAYYRFNDFVHLISKIKFLQKFINFKYVDLYVSNQKLTKVFIITMLRYLVYVNQYILLCYFFSINVDYPLMFSIVSTMILTQTIGFSLPLIDLPIRGGVLLYLLQNHTDNQLNILFVILLVWILNLVLPAIVGYLNFLGLKMEVKNEKLNKHT